MTTDQPAPPNRGFRFDFTINLGHVLSAGVMIAAMVMGWANFDTRLAAVEKQFSTATTLLLDQTRLSERMSALDMRMARIERLLETRP